MSLSRLPLVYALVRGFSELTLRLGHRMRVRGLEHVPRHGGAVLVSNHSSFLDPMALAGAIRFRVLHFMARDTLCHAPVIGWLMPRLQLILIDRERGDVAALKTTLRLLKEGELVGLFPEGTRSPDGNLQTARGGIGFLVSRARVPVIPVYVDGTYRALSRHHRFPRPARVTVTIGPPIPPDRLEALGSGRDALQGVADLIMDQIGALRGSVSDPSGGSVHHPR